MHIPFLKGSHKTAMGSLKDILNLSNTTLASEATRVLRNAILAGYFQPAERILETDLAEELNISRATLRHAIRDLVNEGLLVNPPRKGTYVVELDRDDIIEIYEVRLALETLAACKLCNTLTAEQIEYIQSLLEAMRQPTSRSADVELYELDMRFHESICRFSGNEHLYKVWMQLKGQLLLYFAASQRKFAFPDFAHRHEQILTAIISKDKSLVRDLVRGHIRDGVPLMTGDDEEIPFDWI